MQRFAITTTTIISCALLSATAFARPHGHHGHLDPSRIQQAAEAAGVDNATMSRIKDRLYDVKKASVPLRGDLELARIDLHRMLDTASPDRAAIMAQIDKLGALKLRMKKLKLEAMLDVRQMLSADQLRRFRRNFRGHHQGAQRRHKGPKYEKGARH